MIYVSKVWRRTRRRARLAVASIAAMVTAAALIAIAPYASAHPGQPSAVFDPNSVSWAGKRDRTIAEFDADIATYAEAGMYPVDIEVDSFSGGLTFGGAFQKNLDGRAWLVDTVMTGPEYDATFEDAKKRGLRLIDREVYTHNGVRHYGAAWVGNPEGLGWHAEHDLTLAQLNALVDNERARGRMPIDFDMYRTSGGIRYGVITLDNPEGLDWHLHADLSEPAYTAKWAEYRDAGFRMLSFDSAPTAQTQLFGGIWLENANGRAWGSWRSMTSKSYGNNWHAQVDQGFRQIFVGRYETPSGVRYASLWRQNDDRYDWRYRVNADEEIADEMDDDDLPGVSVAVIENGQFRYTRGFGHADIANNVTMDSDHVLRTASVSKAVGGALALRLSDASGSFDVKSTAGEHLDDLPSHHTATLEELASNRGCVRHYADADDVADPEEFEAQQDADTHLRSTEFNSAYGALLHFQDDPLVLGCSVGDDEVYSTHGYTMLGAALEATADVAIADLVTGLISQPFDLDTLRLEDMGDTSVRRAKLYKNGDNELATADEISWKVLGGGLESTAKDLARFADRLQDGGIVEDPEYIWDGADQGWDYAYGWNIRSDHNGHRRVGKSGGQLGSDAYLLMYPDDAVAIAVLINREELAEDDDNARRIAEAVGELMF